METLNTASAILGLLATAAVLLPAFAGFGRPRTYATLGFVFLIAGGLMMVLTPTPRGFDPAGASDRPFVSSTVGQAVSVGLFSAGAAGLLGAFVASRKRPTTVEEMRHTRP